MATIVDVLSSVITSINNVAQLVKDSIIKVDTRNDALIAILNDRFKSIEERDKKLAAGMQKMYETILEMQEQLENNSSSDNPNISAGDMDKLMGMLKAEKSEKDEITTPKKPKAEPKAEPKEEPEDVDEEIDEEEAEEASDNESSPNEIKSIFQSKSTGRQRIICMNYLKQAGRKSECRMPDKLTWDYCSGIKKDEDDSKPAMEQWLAFVVEYDKQNG